MSRRCDQGRQRCGRDRRWLEINANYAKLWPNITVTKPAPADAKEYEKATNKKEMFSSNPGDGD